MYGSSFCIRTFSPRPSSSIPIDALASPLPSELTTPPVTKMNLVIQLPPLELNPFATRKTRFYRPWLVLRTAAANDAICGLKARILSAQAIGLGIGFPHDL